MTVTGHVENGQIVLDAGVTLPEGLKVEITPLNGAMQVESEEIKPSKRTLYDRYKKIIGIANDLPEDFAINHDHYIHGTAKRQ